MLSIISIQFWAIFDCGVTAMFISKRFKELHQKQVKKVHGNVRDRRGKVMARRTGTGDITVLNRNHSVECTDYLLDMPGKRGFVISLIHFEEFGFRVQGVPNTLMRSSENEDSDSASVNDTRLPDDVFDGLTAKYLSLDVETVLQMNQKLPMSVRCKHPLAVLEIEPTDTSPIWHIENYISLVKEERISEIIEKWYANNVIELALEVCTNCFS